MHHKFYLNMEKMDVFDCSNIFIVSYFTNDRDCAHCNHESIPMNWKSPRETARQTFVPETGRSCVVTTVCGFRNMSIKISHTVPLS